MKNTQINKNKVDKNTIITTYDGTKAKRGDCRWIRSKYYITEKQCFLINKQWYRADNEDIVYDHELGKWRLKSEGEFLYGVVGYDINKDSFIYGSFTPNPLENTLVYNMKPGPSVTIETVMNERIMQFADYTEGTNGIFYSEKIKYSSSIAIQVKSKALTTRKEETYNFPYVYGSAPLIPSFVKKFQLSAKDISFSNSYSNLLPYTFGFEFETNTGVIPERYLFRNGLIACRDGSISGFEYVTIPLGGDVGLESLKRDCDKLQKFCSIDNQQSVHIHLGGFKKSIPNIVALYRLITLIQNELYSLFPANYVHTSAFKRRDYCSPLPPISGLTKGSNAAFEYIFEALGGVDFSGKLSDEEHPLDRSGQHKWNVDPRYRICNFVPIIWGDRKTIEFRVHVPTFNFDKISYWLFICSAILAYTENNRTKLLARLSSSLKEINLFEILSEVYPKPIVNKIMQYMDIRKYFYEDNYSPSGDQEITEELKFYLTGNLPSLDSLGKGTRVMLTKITPLIT